MDKRSRLFTCDACGDPITAHVVLDSEDWVEIAQGAYALCCLCIDERAINKGMKVVGHFAFNGAGLISDGLHAIGGWRTKEMAAQQPLHPGFMRGKWRGAPDKDKA